MSTILQNSELRKGLIFHAPLSEWSMTPGTTTTSGSLVVGKTYTIKLFVAGDSFTNVGAASNATGVTFVATGTTPTTWTNSSQLTLQKYGYMDMVSKAVGVATDCVPVLDKSGSGRRWIEYNGTSSFSSFTAIAAFGAADFMVTGKIKTGALGAIRTIIGGVANSFEINVSATGYLTARKVGAAALTASITLLVASTEYTFAYVRSSTTGTYYINGVVAGTTTDANDYSVGCTLVGNATGFFNGSAFMVRAFNFAGTSTRAINYQKAEYPIELIHRGAGATKNILDLNAEGMASATWKDVTNTLTATNSGTTYVCPSASNLKASYFNGTTSKVSFGNINKGDIYSIAVKFHAGQIINSSLAGESLMSFGGANNQMIYLGSLTGSFANEVITIGSSNNCSYVPSSYYPTLSIGWHTLVLVWDGARYIPYIDGVYYGYLLFGTPTIWTGSDVWIGSWSTNAGFFAGNIGSVSAWSRLITTDEVALLNAIL